MIGIYNKWRYSPEVLEMSGEEVSLSSMKIGGISGIKIKKHRFLFCIPLD